MKKIMLVITGVLLAVSLIFINVSKMEEVENVTFEVLDESLLNENSLKTWMDKNSKEEGVYWTKKGDSTYVMITYGETDKSNINICLEEIQPGKKTKLNYSIINEHNYSETVEKYVPKMILKINTSIKSIEWGKIENK